MKFYTSDVFDYGWLHKIEVNMLNYPSHTIANILSISTVQIRNIIEKIDNKILERNLKN